MLVKFEYNIRVNYILLLWQKIWISYGRSIFYHKNKRLGYRKKSDSKINLMALALNEFLNKLTYN